MILQKKIEEVETFTGRGHVVNNPTVLAACILAAALSEVDETLAQIGGILNGMQSNAIKLFLGRR